VDGGDKLTLSSKDLMDKGVAVTLLGRPNSAVLQYRRKM
jgi:hypothetical protein